MIIERCGYANKVNGEMNRGCLHGIIKKRSDSLNLLFKDALVDYAIKLWKYDIITDAVRENVLDPGKGGKEERASSLFTALYNAVKVADLANQTVHMIHLVDILEDVSGAQIGAVLRKDLADFDIHIPLRMKRPVPVSDHKGYHSETTCVNESQMGMLEERDDRELCKKVVRLLCRVLESHHHRLLKALEGDSLLSDFASKMLEKGLISKPIKSGSFDEIMADFQTCWELMNLMKLEVQCVDFLDILRDLGGSCRMAADVLEGDWSKNVEEEIKETFLHTKRFHKTQSAPQNYSKKPVINWIQTAYSETDLLQLSIDESQHVLGANGGRNQTQEQGLVSNGSPHFTTSFARPMNNDPNDQLVPGRNQKQSLTLSFSQTHHEDSGIPHTSQTISASSLSTLQSSTAPESHTPYQEESFDQTRDLSGIRKRFVAPTQATHIRQSQSGPSDTAHLQSQPFSSTHSSDLFIQSLKEDKGKLEVEKTSDKREDKDSQFYSIENIAYKLQETEAQLQAALQSIMELNNENELFKKISDDNHRELKLLKTKEKSSQERVQCLEDKISLLIGENEALSDVKDSELEMLKTKLKTKDESIKELIKEKDAIKKTSLIKDKDLTYWKGAMKSSQEKVQALETKLLLTTVKKPVSQRDAIVQFDYWVPMEDLLHGAHIVDERVFNVQGDKEQYFNWNECGFRLYIPKGALLSTETCPVAVKAIIAGRFILPKRTELVSAFYAISASRKLRKKVKTELQHCLLLENEAQTEHLHFIKAHQTNPGLPYHFELQPGGEFMVNTRYAALWQSEFSIEAIVKVQPYPDDESGSNNQASGNGSENSTEEEGDQNQEEDQNTDEVTSKEGSDDENISSNNELLVNTNSQECPKSIKSQVEEPNTQLTINLESKNTQTEQITDFDNGLYRAHTFYEKVSRHEWIFKFAAIKHLNVHIKYIEESDALKHLEKAESFEFRFKEDPQGYIYLNVSNTESLPNSWHVDPYSLPCGISKTSIDLLATQFQESPDSSVLHVYPVIPMCMISIHADPDTSLRLRYAVPVEGIVEIKTIFIMRSIAIEAPGATLQKQEKEEGAKGNSTEETDTHGSTVDTKQVTRYIKQVMETYHPALSGLFEGLLKTVASEMLSVGLIPHAIEKNPTFDGIMTFFLAGFAFKAKLEDVEKHCVRFFNVFYKIGGPFVDAADMIKQTIQDTVKDNLGVQLNINV